MELQYLRPARGFYLKELEKFLAESGLDFDPGCTFTVNALEDDEIIATGSLEKNVLKCIAVSEKHQGEGLSATIITALRSQAFDNGEEHLFLFTKPKNLEMFGGLGFYPVAKTQDALLMESVRSGCDSFVAAIPKKEGTIGAVVVNCNPFTLGHRYLIEQASSVVDWLYVFVLSEDKSFFPADVRFDLVKKGTADLSNVIVCPTGKYMISSATFPTYFIKDKTKVDDIKCDMDIEVFSRKFAPALNITRRFVGTEPHSAVTNAYNQRLQKLLPDRGIELTIIERKTSDGAAISASRVRKLIEEKNRDALLSLLSPTTMEYVDRTFFADK